MTIHLLTVSQLPACSLGCYGEHRIPTPCFDALAAQALVCNNYFSCSVEASFSNDLISRYHWPAPPLELSTLFRAAECWLNDEQVAEIFSPLNEEETTLDAAQSRMHRKLTPFQHQLIESTATVLAHDAALGEFVDGLEIEEDDLLIVMGQNGDRRRLPVDRPEMLAGVSDAVVKLPLLIFSPTGGSVGRVNELLGVEDVDRLLSICTGQEGQPILAWQEALTSSAIKLQTASVAAIRTLDFLLVDLRRAQCDTTFSTDDASSAISLYHKPEDRWEMLDVASQFPELIEHYVQTGELVPLKVAAAH